ncbi:hypothetical protein B4Q13_20460, partial [Lacticaseibacillus rhamnosus]
MTLGKPEWCAHRAVENGRDFLHVNGMAGKFYLPEIMAPGVALLDYDNDGDLDPAADEPAAKAVFAVEADLAAEEAGAGAEAVADGDPGARGGLEAAAPQHRQGRIAGELGVGVGPGAAPEGRARTAHGAAVAAALAEPTKLTNQRHNLIVLDAIFVLGSSTYLLKYSLLCRPAPVNVAPRTTKHKGPIRPRIAQLCIANVATI